MCIFNCIIALCFQIRILKYSHYLRLLTKFCHLPGCQGMYRVHSLRNIARLMRGYGFEGDDFDWEIMDSDLDSAEDVPRLQWSVQWQAFVIFFHLRPCALLAARILMKGDPSLWSSRRWGFQYDAAWQHKKGKRWKTPKSLSVWVSMQFDRLAYPMLFCMGLAWNAVLLRLRVHSCVQPDVSWMALSVLLVFVPIQFLPRWLIWMHLEFWCLYDSIFYVRYVFCLMFWIGYFFLGEVFYQFYCIVYSY